MTAPTITAALLLLTLALARLFLKYAPEKQCRPTNQSQSSSGSRYTAK